jgi:hypothetical protein
MGAEALSKIDRSVISGPDVIGWMKLGDRRWVAPFGMSGNIPDLIGTKVLLDGKLFDPRHCPDHAARAGSEG